MEDYLQNISHRRFNILTGEWVLVSPHRSKRPWLGQEEEFQSTDRLTHDPSCYLCAGNTRANGEVNPPYKDIYVFNNDFAALTMDNDSFNTNHNLIKAEVEEGICRVVCFSPDHSKSLSQMSLLEIEKVIDTWRQEYESLGKLDTINYVQIFENKGEIMGCSNPHPHGQIWSQSSLPNEVVKKDRTQINYYNTTKSSLLGDYLNQELKLKERVIFENTSFVILVPFWAVWPFETMIIPKSHQTNIKEITISETRLYAEAISKITKAYDRLFNCSFPYSSGIHQSPTNDSKNDHWHWHMSFYPPLLRSATVKKFMVGYEMFASPQRDITPEVAAQTLRKHI